MFAPLLSAALFLIAQVQTPGDHPTSTTPPGASGNDLIIQGAGAQGLAPPLRLPYFPDRNRSHVDWPEAGFGGEGIEGRLITGEFTGDHHVDGVQIVDGRAVLLYGPGIYSAVIDITDAIDATTLEATSNGAPDRLVVLGADGLYEVSNYDAGSFTFFPLGDESWEGALRVVGANVDGNAAPDLVGIKSTGTELLILRDALLRSGNPTQSIPLPHHVQDLIAVNWTGGKKQELAVLHADGVDIYKSNGNRVDGFSVDLIDGFLAPFDQKGYKHQRVASVVEFANVPDQYMWVADNAMVEAPIWLSNVGAYAVTCADIDADKDEDLILAHRFSHFALLLFNESDGVPPGVEATFSASFQSVQLIDLGLGGQSAPTQTGFPALGDLSADGDPDFLMHVDELNQVVVVENDVVDQTEQDPLSVEGDWVFNENDLTGKVRLDVTARPTPGFTPTHVQVVVWRQNELHEAPLGQAHSSALLDLQGGTLVQTQVIVPAPQIAVPEIYHLELRSVYAPQGWIEAVGPTRIVTFTSSYGTLVGLMHEYAELPNPLTPYIIPLGQTEEQIYLDPDDRELAPAIITIPRIPAFNVPPDPLQ